MIQMYPKKKIWKKNEEDNNGENKTLPIRMCEID